jgi:hypothetical protein
MANFDFSPYARGGAAARPDSFTGMQDPFQQALARMLQDAPAEVKIGITSGYRSPEVQERLWQEALVKYGSPEKARKWVAPPGRSQHNHGAAADLEYLSPEAQEWVHANAERYGLAFPLSNEAWHVELAGARGEHQHASPTATTANALGGTNALRAAALPSNGSLGSAATLATRAPPAWIKPITPPSVTFTPLELPTRRRA